MDKKTYYDKLLSDAFHFVKDINFDGAKMGIYKNGERIYQRRGKNAFRKRI